MDARPTTARFIWLVAGVAFVFGAATLGLVLGPTDISSWGTIVETADRLTPFTFDSGLSETQKSIVWNLRLPRVALGLLVGASLATAGATYQGVFRNPLADPYLLGVAAGGGLGATVAFVNDWGNGEGVFDGVQLAAFVGALLAVALTWIVGVAGDRDRSAASLILAGVAVASFFTALQTFLQQRNTEDIREIYTWFLGGLTTSGWSEVLQLLPVAVVLLLVLSLTGRTLDIMAVGDEEASMLGLAVPQVRVGLLVIASLLTAAAVAVSGLIAFVGLIVPHAVRLIFGSTFRVIVPLSIFAGAGFLALSDLAARTILTPTEIPIGVITAFFGAPFFIFILRTTGRR
ncbi:MAG: iron ABC transporter permease [Acidimicrobiales bacterium]|nr:iron ABC transporter permease [Acidimicrobiales bacterium]RZV46452.1 MAG: iron ABC transporter permease [Acidimicrobiales bacterium]